MYSLSQADSGFSELNICFSSDYQRWSSECAFVCSFARSHTGCGSLIAVWWCNNKKWKKHSNKLRRYQVYISLRKYVCVCVVFLTRSSLMAVLIWQTTKVRSWQLVSSDWFARKDPGLLPSPPLSSLSIHPFSFKNLPKRLPVQYSQRAVGRAIHNDHHLQC